MVHKVNPSPVETEVYMTGFQYGLNHGKYSQSFLPKNPFRLAGEEAGIRAREKKLEEERVEQGKRLKKLSHIVATKYEILNKRAVRGMR